MPDVPRIPVPHRWHPMPGQVLMITPDGELDRDYVHEEGVTSRVPPIETTDLDQATTITSKIEGALGLMHKVVLDIDLPCRLIESSTPGHYHLYIDTPVPWIGYRNLLDALAAAGIIQPGYANASRDRGYTRLRLPWIRKRPAPLPAPEQARLGVLDGAL